MKTSFYNINICVQNEVKSTQMKISKLAMLLYKGKGQPVKHIFPNAEITARCLPNALAVCQL